MRRNPYLVGTALFVLGGLAQYVGGVVAWTGTVVAILGVGIFFAALVDNAI